MASDLDSSFVYVLDACLSVLQIMQCGGASTRDHICCMYYTASSFHNLCEA